MVQEAGSAKLRDLVTTSNDVITTQSDSNSEGKLSSNISSNDTAHNNNIARTLDFLVKDAQNPFVPQEAKDEKEPKQILLICGSFFIMQDVRQYFGYKQEIDYE